MTLSPCDWESLIERYFGQENPGCTMMRCVSLVPGHLVRGSQPNHEEPGLVSEVKANHRKLQDLTFASRRSLEQNKALFDIEQTTSTRSVHALCLRAHSVSIAVLIVLNRVSFAIDVTSCWNLSQEAEQLSHEILTLTQEAEQYAPFGSSYVAFCLCAAWIGFQGCDHRSLVESLLLDFYSQNETVTLVDVLRVKVQELEGLRTARSIQLNAASSILQSHEPKSRSSHCALAT